jgi:hypothetical protein
VAGSAVIAVVLIARRLMTATALGTFHLASPSMALQAEHLAMGAIKGQNVILSYRLPTVSGTMAVCAG